MSALSEARSLAASGRNTEAVEQLRTIDPSDQDWPQAVQALAECTARLHRWGEAEEWAVQAVATGGDTLPALLVLGQALRSQKKFGPAAEALQQAMALDASRVPVRPRIQLALCLERTGHLADAEACLREAHERYPTGGAGTRLAELMYHHGKRDEGVALARTILAADPEDSRARSVVSLAGATRHGGGSRRTVPWPSKTNMFADAKKLIKSSLLSGYPQGGPFIRPDTRFVTIGSCFARNLAHRLKLSGYEVYSEMIGEDINNTYANRYFFEWIEHGPTTPETKMMQEAYGSDLRDRYLEALRACNVLVFTLGLAPTYFSAETGGFAFFNNTFLDGKFMLENFRMRTTTVDENVQNLQAIIETVSRLSPGVKFVLTVSPVPLAATSERQSAVMADCVSKSILRVACDTVCSSDTERVVYWPSFEIVRWLGPHFAGLHPAVYGVEDGKSRHVSTWIVDLIIELFQETFRVRDAA